MTETQGLKTEPDRLRRQYELRKRREAIIRELGRFDKILSDEQTLELTREFRRIQAELDGREIAA